MTIAASQIKRIHYGYFIGPADHPLEGQPIPVSGFLVPHSTGTLLFDTGMSPADEEVRERYHPRLQTALEALATIGAGPKDVDRIANCHLHVDHAGNNYLFPDTPVLVQDAELTAAKEPDFTFPHFTFDYPGAALEVIDGETDIAPGLRLVPTPGHTPGHQSLLVDTDAGRWLLAGQASNSTWEFSSQAFAERIAAAGHEPIGTFPDWMPRLREWGVNRAFFAHDMLVWDRDETDLGHPTPA